MFTALATHEPIAPTDEEIALARDSIRRLSGLTEHDLCVHLLATNEDVALPAAAVQLLVTLLSEMAEGNAVALTPVHSELTTQQAADFLGVSRPFLVKLLEERKLPHRKVGTHRRVLFVDLMSYRRKIDEQRIETFEELASQAQELDMGY